MINLYNHSFSADYANEERGVKEQQHNLLIALDLCRSGCHFFVVSVTIEHDWNKLWNVHSCHTLLLFYLTIISEPFTNSHFEKRKLDEEYHNTTTTEVLLYYY